MQSATECDPESAKLPKLPVLCILLTHIDRIISGIAVNICK